MPFNHPFPLPDCNDRRLPPCSHRPRRQRRVPAEGEVRRSEEARQVTRPFFSINVAVLTSLTLFCLRHSLVRASGMATVWQRLNV